MDSDIRLDDDRIVMQAWDLDFSHPDRRDQFRGPSPHRRALVHWRTPTAGDQLVLNFDADYPAGVKIASKLIVRDYVSMTNLTPMAGGPDDNHPPETQDVDIVEQIAILRRNVAALWKLTFVQAQALGGEQLALAHSVFKYGGWEGELEMGSYQGPYKPTPKAPKSP